MTTSLEVLITTISILSYIIANLKLIIWIKQFDILTCSKFRSLIIFLYLVILTLNYSNLDNKWNQKQHEIHIKILIINKKIIK